MRGRRRGQILRVREWDGLWNFGERYDIGQRVLLFLYPNSKLGLTRSPVGGALERYQIDKSGHVLVHDDSSPRGPRPIQLRSFAAAIKRGEELIMSTVFLLFVACCGISRPCGWPRICGGCKLLRPCRKRNAIDLGKRAPAIPLSAPITASSAESITSPPARNCCTR